MTYLLDTCAILHLSKEPHRLSNIAKVEATNPDNAMCCSVVSVGELACLQERKKIDLPDHWRSWFRWIVQENGWTVLPVTQSVMEEAYSLPGDFHRDPVDRILVATARLHRMTLITTDGLILDYPHVESLS
jgi:PIN domain nuclease of toxin-antitoxin system